MKTKKFFKEVLRKYNNQSLSLKIDSNRDKSWNKMKGTQI